VAATFKKQRVFMRGPGLTVCLVAACLLAGPQARAQAVSQLVYYSASSATLSQNTLDGVSSNGVKSTLFTATGIDLNKVTRCTAVAADASNEKLFFLDGAAGALWSVNLDGSGLALVKNGLTNFPTDLALDVPNQQIYYTTSSTVQQRNTVQRMDYTGNNNTVLFTATGAPPDNAVLRCTAIALDLSNSKIFIADAGARKIWSMSLTGGGVTPLFASAGATPTGMAVDAGNQQVYFTLSSPVQGSNLIERVNYNGSGLITLFTASGGVQRCTALDVDLAHDTIYLSDAGTAALWRVPLSGGSATSLLSGLGATAKKVRWFGGVTARPSPGIVSLQISGTQLIFNGTNGSAGGTYYVLTSTNVTTPLSQWLPVSTNVLASSGSFMITATNGYLPATPQQFYIIRVQ
jgi:hypothetical protein